MSGSPASLLFDALLRGSARLSRGLLVLAAVWAFGVCFLVVADVLARNLLGTSLKGTPEIVAASIVAITFLQAGYAVRSGSMLHATFLLDRLSPGGVRAARLAGFAIGALFFALLALGALPFAIDSLVGGEYEGEGSLRIPSWPARWIIVLGAALASANYALLLGLETLGVQDPADERGPVPPAGV